MAKKRELYAETACLHCNQKGRENIKTDCKVCGGSGWRKRKGSRPRSKPPKKDNSSFVLAVGVFCIAWLMIHKDPETGKKDLAGYKPPPSDVVYEKSYADSPPIEKKKKETQNKTAPSRGEDEKEPELKVLLRTLDGALRD